MDGSVIHIENAKTFNIPQNTVIHYHIYSFKFRNETM